MKKIVFTFFIIAGFISCNNVDDSIEIIENNYLIFGHFYGECVGEGCIETYKLTNEKLFEDITDDYSGQNLEFVELENDLFLEVNDLVDFFPNQLLDETETIIGCPDCADGGGLFIQYSDNEDIMAWRIDQNKNNVPTYLHDFMDKVNEKIQIINN